MDAWIRKKHNSITNVYESHINLEKPVKFLKKIIPNRENFMFVSKSVYIYIRIWQNYLFIQVWNESDNSTNPSSIMLYMQT